MKIQVGILGNQHSFEQILRQHGIPYSIPNMTEIQDLNSYPVIIVNSLEAYSKKTILHYISTGGTALVNTTVYKILFPCKTKKKQISSVIAGDSIYKDIGLIDFYDIFNFPQDKELITLDSALHISQRKYGAGFVINFPFDVEKLLNSYQSMRKKFHAERNELPSERVSRVSKGKISQIIYSTIEYLFHARDVPFVHAWYYPDDYEGLFSFRVDTDFCNADDASSLLSICENNAIRGTWFVDTESKEMLNNVYAQMKEQEIALHCDRHLVFKDYKQNLTNIESGLSKLQKAGITVKGFAAPFGEWNPALNKTLNELTLNYSSEFVYDFDDYPLFPDESHVLQIPIHPISIGRLRRSHFSDEEMVNYFKKVILKKRITSQPIILYHHPHHQRFEVIDEIFKFIAQFNFWKPTMSEYCEWCRERNESSIEAQFEDDILKVKNNNPNLAFRTTQNIRYFSIIKSNQSIKLSDIQWKEKSSMSVPADISRTRKWHWRDTLYNYETSKAKAGK